MRMPGKLRGWNGTHKPGRWSTAWVAIKTVKENDDVGHRYHTFRYDTNFRTFETVNAATSAAVAVVQDKSARNVRSTTFIMNKLLTHS